MSWEERLAWFTIAVLAVCGTLAVTTGVIGIGNLLGR